MSSPSKCKRHNRLTQISPAHPICPDSQVVKAAGLNNCADKGPRQYQRRRKFSFHNAFAPWPACAQGGHEIFTDKFESNLGHQKRNLSYVFTRIRKWKYFRQCKQKHSISNLSKSTLSPLTLYLGTFARIIS
jgi:hypothetical protein